MKKKSSSKYLIFGGLALIVIAAIIYFVFFYKKTEDGGDYDNLTYPEQVRLVVNHIKHDTQWDNDVRKKSASNENTYDEQLIKDAEWMLEHKDIKEILNV